MLDVANKMQTEVHIVKLMFIFLSVKSFKESFVFSKEITIFWQLFHHLGFKWIRQPDL